MKLFRILGLALPMLALLPLAAWAQSSKKEKTPSEVAYDNFKKVIGDKSAESDSARQQEILTAGFDFITQHPATDQTDEVILGLAEYGSKLKKAAGSWLALLNYHLLDKINDSSAPEEVRVAFVALDAEVTNAQLRQTGNRGEMPTLRSKIDALAQQKGATRFLPGLEKRYSENLRVFGGVPAAEAHLNKLLEHPEKGVSSMAKDQLNIIKLTTTPLDLKFTALDGTEVDVAAYRGKLVLFWFWSANGESSTKEVDSIKDAYEDHRKNLEVIGVCLDKESDREKVLKYIKDKRLPGRQHFDGKGKNGPLARQMNVERATARLLFNKDGRLISNSIRASALSGDIKKVLAPPADKKK